MDFNDFVLRCAEHRQKETELSIAKQELNKEAESVLKEWLGSLDTARNRRLVIFDFDRDEDDTLFTYYLHDRQYRVTELWLEGECVKANANIYDKYGDEYEGKLRDFPILACLSNTGLKDSVSDTIEYVDCYGAKYTDENF